MEGFDAATYGDRFADVYDDWYPATAETDACVEALAALARRNRSGGPDHGSSSPPVVLELAVGTGRLALPLAATGLDVRGIDASPAMLHRLRAKPGADAVAVAAGDLAEPFLPRRPDDPPEGARVDVVFVAHNTVFALPGPDARIAAFRAIAALLGPAGWFAFDAFVPPTGVDHDATDSAVTIRTMTADRVVLSAATRDRRARTITGQFLDFTNGTVRLRPYHLHFAEPSELDAEAAAAGLALHTRWADWTGTPFDDASDAHVSIYRHPAKPQVTLGA